MKIGRLLFLALLLIACLGSERLSAGIVILSGDAGINNAIDGSGGSPLNTGASTFFLNLLGSSNNVLIHNRFVPQETGLGTTAIDNLYDSQLGVTSTTDYPGGEVTASLLSNIDLFIIRPRLAFSSSEIQAMRDFVEGTGKLYLIGENSSFNVAQDTVNALLAGIGSSMRLEGSTIDGGFFTTTDVAVDPLTVNVGSITYNLTNTVSGGTPLFRSVPSSGSQVILSYETLTAIPEPSGVLMLFCGMAASSLIRRRR